MSELSGFHIVAVCSGNVCRSPLVELALTDRLRASGRFTVASAGIIAQPGERMTEEMVNVATRLGLDEESARSHAATRLDESIVAGADLIIGATRAHRAAVVSLQPRAVRRAFTVVELSRLIAALSADEVAALTPAGLIAAAAERRGVDTVSADDGALDIHDPIGEPQEVYDRVGEQLAAEAEAIASALLATRSHGTSIPRGPRAEPRSPDLAFSFRRL